ncbi:type III-A CRISPR-associated protein Csm2 [Thermoanaerobacterium sp. RBIITD]|uniref:type III-A CRISPR-associated protein Csm2 n=1 Tax=Thermoanaerobacterium sp. RBIITD TaxID=1550240 RepID=UPI000BB92C70|nr:type III-A CRISPR-associated protein Csm2 [Thermoanaerobacterium sp. RBIITD]SNX53622.1 CRISPR-associated protein Csm2 [Thermoanaerobacterium sp. RBIITD]
MPNYNNRPNNKQSYKGQENEAGIYNKIKDDLPLALDPDKDKDGEKLIHVTEELGKWFAEKDKVTISQIRKIYSYTRKLNVDKDDWKFRLKILKAYLAYNAGKFSDFKNFKDVFTFAIDKVNDEKKLERFKNFFEAVIAYHKAYGGK